MEKNLRDKKGILFKLLKERFPECLIKDNSLYKDRFSDLDISIFLNYLPTETVRKKIYHNLDGIDIQLYGHQRDNFFLADSIKINNVESFWIDLAYFNNRIKSDYLGWKYQSYSKKFIDPSTDGNRDFSKRELSRLKKIIDAEFYNLQKYKKRNDALSELISKGVMITLIARHLLLEKYGIYLCNLYDVRQRINITTKDKKFIYNLKEYSTSDLLKLSDELRWK